ncbi:hypothetical protein LWI29_021223 [Acer saccharum]|uniref:Uncharacterized protein n=1 Tax=Acer saccharum TaxID=4024 RepID=A0AA39VIY6_ACESA|nr:hypothetical protein LWI29_021223 [Acer saccharum]
MEEDPAQMEHEQVDHDEGINEERVEQQQQSQVWAQVELSLLQEQDSLVPQQPEQQFQRSIALDKPKRERKKPEKYGFDQDEVNYALNVSQGDPTTDWVESKEVTLEKVHTEENASDYLTKPVTAKKFKFCLNSLNLITC